VRTTVSAFARTRTSKIFGDLNLCLPSSFGCLQKKIQKIFKKSIIVRLQRPISKFAAPCVHQVRLLLDQIDHVLSIGIGFRVETTFKNDDF
jgi:hypothetical protein